MGFSVPSEGNLESLYADDSWLFERYAGDRLWTWGNNTYGQLGNNSAPSNTRSSPVQTVSQETNWRQIECGYGYTAAIKTDGTLWLWGANNVGQLGNNSTSHQSSPVQTIAGGNNWKQISCSKEGYTSSSIAGIKTDGTLWLCGYGAQGKLGNNSTSHQSSPVQTITGGNDWKQVSVGGNHTAAIKTNGSLWLWGRNSWGVIGDNTTTDRSSPVQTATGGTNWKQVACGTSHTAAIKTDKTLWLWGNGNSGQLGGSVSTSTPVQISTGGSWKQVACGNTYSAAIKTDGTLWLWGSNEAGQLGNNTTTSSNAPVQTISGGTNWKYISIAVNNSAAIKTDGTLWVWGYNNAGQIGDNTTTNKSSPVQTVAGGTNWKQVSAHRHTAAITINNINTTGVE